jgi:glutamate dehydrogenase (NAD(P)+)
VRERNPTKRIKRGERIGGEKFALVVETTHGSVTATTAVHRQLFGQRIGGVRFVEEGKIEEVGNLAKAMTEKCLLCEIPADGQKTIVVCPEGLPATNEEKAAVLSEHIRAVVDVDAGVIFGPDMEVDENVQDIIASDADLRDHVTGLSTKCGGLGIDKQGYTGVGLADAIGRALELRRGGGNGIATVQGYGAVGAHVTLPLSKMGVIIKAISNKYGTLVSEETGGINAETLFKLRSSQGDDALRVYAEKSEHGVKFIPDRRALLRVPCDLFVPAARTSVLARSDELEGARAKNSEAITAETFFSDTGVRIVAEGANCPLTEAAERYLEHQGAVILPDVIVNCGGLIGCYFEWAWRRHPSPGSVGELDRRAKEQLKAVLSRNVGYLLRNRAEGARAAVRRIAEKNLYALLNGENQDAYGVRQNAA